MVVEFADLAFDVVHFAGNAFVFHHLFDDALGSGQKGFFFVEIHVFEVLFPVVIDEFFGEVLHEEFAGPGFVTVVVHAFRDALVEDVGLATRPAGFEFAVGTVDFFVIGEVVFFDTYGTGRHLWFVGLGVRYERWKIVCLKYFVCMVFRICFCWGVLRFGLR